MKKSMTEKLNESLVVLESLKNEVVKLKDRDFAVRKELSYMFTNRNNCINEEVFSWPHIFFEIGKLKEKSGSEELLLSIRNLEDFVTKINENLIKVAGGERKFLELLKK